MTFFQNSENIWDLLFLPVLSQVLQKKGTQQNLVGFVGPWGNEAERVETLRKGIAGGSRFEGEGRNCQGIFLDGNLFPWMWFWGWIPGGQWFFLGWFLGLMEVWCLDSGMMIISFWIWDIYMVCLFIGLNDNFQSILRLLASFRKNMLLVNLFWETCPSEKNVHFQMGRMSQVWSLRSERRRQQVGKLCKKRYAFCVFDQIHHVRSQGACDQTKKCTLLFWLLF